MGEGDRDDIEQVPSVTSEGKLCTMPFQLA